MGSPFDSISLDRLRARRSDKWVKHPPDVLPSFIAETDFEAPPPVARVLVDAVAAGDLGYAGGRTERLAGAFAGFARRRWGWDVDPAAVVALPEIMVGVAELLRALTEPGDGVVVVTPAYPPFFTVIGEVGRHVVEVPMAADGLPVDGIRAALADGAKVFLFCNPHNPTGYVARPEELQAVAELDAIVLADEIHAPLTLDGSFVPLGSVSDRAITLTSASKGWNIPGLKCALAVAGPEAPEFELPYDMPDRVGHLGVLATEASFAECDAWLDELLAYLRENRRLLAELLAGTGIGYEPGAATFLAWLDFRGLGLGDDPAAHLLEHGRVALAPGHRFGAPGRGYARLTFGTSEALVREAVARIIRAVA